MRVPAPTDGHCILHSVIIQIGGCVGYLTNSISTEINGMMQHYYEEQNGTNIDDLNQQLRDYIDGDFNLPLVDTIFQILANMLGVVVKIDDCFLNDKQTFWPVGYSKENKYKVLYLERTSRDHYNSLVLLQPSKTNVFERSGQV